LGIQSKNNSKHSRKLIPLLLIGILISGITPFSMKDASAQTVLYGLDSSGGNPSTLYSINPLTGVANAIGPTGFFGCGAMDAHPVTKVLYAICGNPFGAKVLISINPNNGIGALVIAITGSITNPVFDMSFRNSDNVLFVTELDVVGLPTGSLHTLNIITGVGTLVGAGSTIMDPGEAIAFSPGDTLFHSSTVVSTLLGIEGLGT